MACAKKQGAAKPSAPCCQLGPASRHEALSARHGLRSECAEGAAGFFERLSSATARLCRLQQKKCVRKRTDGRNRLSREHPVHDFRVTADLMWERSVYGQ